jgi:(p)ppGpp synthase/HD superfamily hydrolase
MEALLKKIAAFADRAHGEQRRKYADERYIEHPLRVMKMCKDYGYSLPVLAAAILHDVLEDTQTTPGEIKEFLSTLMNEKNTDRTMSLVIELTDVFTKEHYPRLNRRRRKAKEIIRLEKISAEAQTIKYADIIDNAIGIAQHDADFAPVYLNECSALLDKMKKGNKELREKAIEILVKEIEQLNTGIVLLKDAINVPGQQDHMKK